MPGLFGAGGQLTQPGGGPLDGIFGGGQQQPGILNPSAMQFLNFMGSQPGANFGPANPPPSYGTNFAFGMNPFVAPQVPRPGLPAPPPPIPPPGGTGGTGGGTGGNNDPDRNK